MASFFNALSWIVLIPVWQYPDEQAHFAQVQNTAESGQNPNVGFDTSFEVSYSEKILRTERDEFGNNSFTYHPEYKIPYTKGAVSQEEVSIKTLPKSSRAELVKREVTMNPPLYYFLAAFLYKVAYKSDLFTRVYAVRLLSTSFFILLILVTYQIAKELFGKNGILVTALTSLVAFKPMLVFSSTGVLPDSAVNLLFTTVLLVCLRIIKKGISSPTVLFLGLLIITGVLTRQHFLVVIPIISLAIFINFLKNKQIIKIIILMILLLLVFLAINYQAGAVPEIAMIKYQLLLDKSFLDYSIWTVKHSIAEVLPWYWGVYKWLSLTVPHINYQIINRLIIIALIGLVARAILVIRQKKIENLDVNLIFLISASLIYFAVFAVGDYLFNRLYGYSFGIQGRYFFPLIVFHMALLLIGLLQIFKLFLKRYTYVGIVILIFLMILFNNISLSYVAASYYDFSSFSNFFEHAIQYKPAVIKGMTIPLIILINLILQSAYIFLLLKSFRNQTLTN